MSAQEPPVHPLKGADGDPPPPLREQLPLPQRRRLSHLEPQLRTPHSAGDGTPFAAFDAATPAPDSARPDGVPSDRAGGGPSDARSGPAPIGQPRSVPTVPAAAFVDGRRRAAAVMPAPQRQAAHPVNLPSPRRSWGRDQASRPPGSGGTASR